MSSSRMWAARSASSSFSTSVRLASSWPTPSGGDSKSGLAPITVDSSARTWRASATHARPCRERNVTSDPSMAVTVWTSPSWRMRALTANTVVHVVIRQPPMRFDRTGQSSGRPGNRPDHNRCSNAWTHESRRPDRLASALDVADRPAAVDRRHHCVGRRPPSRRSRRR